MNNSDIIIIGSGPGGYRTAAYAASKGMSVEHALTWDVFLLRHSHVLPKLPEK